MSARLSAFLVLTALGLAACGGSSPRSTVTTRTAVTRTVTHSVTETVTTPATSRPPATNAGTSRCTPRDLGIRFVRGLGAAGTAYLQFAFVNVSSSACTLEGYPGVSVVLSSGRVADIANDRDSSKAIKRVKVAPGGLAGFYVGVHGNAAHPCVSITHFRFIPPNATAYEQIAFKTQVCGGSVVVSPVGYG